VILVERIDVISAVVTTVHDQLYLLVAQDIQFSDKLADCFYIRYVAGYLAIVERKTAFFSKKNG
jgi:hypothetical protein